MSYLNNHIHNIHFVGIGGVSMSALAEIMLQKGYHVTGSDMQKSQAVTTLVTKGIDIIIGHKSQNVNGKDLIIYTGAVKKDNPELVEAARLGIPAVERAPFMGELLSKYQNPIAVSGTHGKTTTTSMLAQIFLDSEKDPTVLVGGAMPATGTNYHIGHSDTIIFEACEYLNSFLNFPSKIAVVLNIDADHLDFFRDIDEIKASFSKFISKTGSDGTAVLCGDDKNCRDIAKNYQGTSVYTSLVDPTADYFAEIKSISGYPVFDVYEHGKLLGDLSLIIPGRHNVYNALAAIAVARISGISFEEIKSSLSKFKGARRRFEYVGCKNGVTIVDDYAHHPSEIKATLTAAASMGYKKTICIFQPHTYSRTHLLFNDFTKALTGCDTCLLVDIYAAREKNTMGISSNDLALKMGNAVYCGGFENAVEYLRQHAEDGTLVITMGAGDIYKVGQMFLKSK